MIDNRKLSEWLRGKSVSDLNFVLEGINWELDKRLEESGDSNKRDYDGYLLSLGEEEREFVKRRLSNPRISLKVLSKETGVSYKRALELSNGNGKSLILRYELAKRGFNEGMLAQRLNNLSRAKTKVGLDAIAMICRMVYGMDIQDKKENVSVTNNTQINIQTLNQLNKILDKYEEGDRR